VGFIDAALDVDDETYKRLMSSSKEHTAALLSDPAEAAKPLREIAFCLPMEAKRTAAIEVADPPERG
jgi:hypothetical protein